jgi:hypothetical protein
MDFKQRVRISFCTCGLCIALGVTIETAHPMHPNGCGVRREVTAICGEPEAIMPQHAPHTDIGTPGDLRATVVTSSSGNGGVVHEIRVGDTLRINDGLDVRIA